jgi:hypothetical protein
MIEALSDKSASLFGAIARCNMLVFELTRAAQRPYYTSDLNGDIYLFRLPWARQRIGLTISVDGVKGHSATLANVARDAAAWSDLLKRAGFETLSLTNPTVRDVQAGLEKVSSTALRDRRGSLEGLPIQRVGLEPKPRLLPKVRDTLVVVFYSGVGFTFGELDYLATSDTNMDPEANLPITSIELRGMLDSLRDNAVTIVAIDTNFNRIPSSSR